MASEFQSSAVRSVVPDVILDIDKSLETSKPIEVQNLLQYCEDNITKIDRLGRRCTEKKRNYNKKLKSVKLETNQLKEKVYSKEQEAELLRNDILQKSKTLTLIKREPCNEDEVSDLMSKLCSVKNRVEEDKRNLKKGIEMYRRGIFSYKKFLNVNAIILPKNIVIFTTCDAKTIPEPEIYLKLKTNDKGDAFQYVDMKPKLDIEKALVKRFNQTRDIQGLILFFLKTIKVLEEEKENR